MADESDKAWEAKEIELRISLISHVERYACSWDLCLGVIQSISAIIVIMRTSRVVSSRCRQKWPNRPSVLPENKFEL